MWRNLASRWQQLDRVQRLALMEAVWVLAAAQAAVRLLRFDRIAPGLGRPGELENPAALSPQQVQAAQRIGWAVRAAAHRLPWEVKCLPQAIAAKWMTRRRGLPATFYLGVDRGQGTWLEAHAWLRCGDEFLTGEPEHERFKVIAAFSGDGR